MKTYWLIYAASVIGTALLIPFSVLLITGDWFFREALWAFGLTLAHGSSVFYVNARSIREGHVHLLYWGLGLHAGRVILMLSLVLSLYLLQIGNLVPFITALMAGYACFLFSEILGLYHGISRQIELNSDE